MTEITFGKEQAMLADIAVKFFRDKWPIESVRDQLVKEDGFDADLWSEMVDLGWLGIAVPEENGGLGLGAMELVTLAEPMGRSLFGSPFVSTQLAIQAVLAGGSEDHRSEWLPLLAEGAIGTLATVERTGDWDLEKAGSAAEESGSTVSLSGSKSFVLDGPVADLVVATVQWRGEPAVALLRKSVISAPAFERETVIDETRRSYRLTLDDIAIEPSDLITGDAARNALRAVRNTALLLLAAEACGGAAGTLNVILEYLKSRLQFGKPIGSYQALKHPTVDILCDLERARSHLYHAATIFGEPEAEAALRMAKAAASDAFAFAGDRAIQFHGAVGFTYECDAQLFLRRALWCQYQYGDALHHRQRLAELLL